MVHSLGADHVFDYKQQNYTESSNRYDLIVDMVSNHSLSDNRRVLQSDGSLVVVGGAKGNWIAPLIGPIKAMLTSPFVSQEISVMFARLVPEDLVTLADMMSDGLVTPVIDQRYALRDVADAIRHSETGRARGKILVRID